MPAAPRHIEGLSEIFAPYEGFILDLWGVVHNGVSPLPGALPALEMLKKAERKVWLLSNAPRRAHKVAEKMTQMGISPDLYDGLLTSGEASWEALRDGLLEKWGKRCLHIGITAGNDSLHEGLDVELVEDPNEADFVLCSAIDHIAADTAGKHAPLLHACASRNLPMLCANPDKVVHIADHLIICPGTLAEMYEKMEGQVTYFGKPHREVYRRCFGEMGTRKVLAVGDSMMTDIAGATGAGLDSVLVTSGIHREEMQQGQPVADFLGRYPYHPTYLMESFGW